MRSLYRHAALWILGRHQKRKTLPTCSRATGHRKRHEIVDLGSNTRELRSDIAAERNRARWHVYRGSPLGPFPLAATIETRTDSGSADKYF